MARWAYKRTVKRTVGRPPVRHGVPSMNLFDRFDAKALMPLPQPTMVRVTFSAEEFRCVSRKSNRAYSRLVA